MKQISYPINHAPYILSNVAKDLDCSVRNDYYFCECDSLLVKQKAVFFDGGFSFLISEFTPNEAIRVERNGTQNPNLILLDFHVSDKGTLKLLDYHGPDQIVFGAYFSSSSIKSYVDFKKGTQNKQVSIIIEKQWLIQKYGHDNSELVDLINNNLNFFLFQRIGFDIVEEIHQLYINALKEKIDQNLVHGQALKILSLFFLSFRNNKSDFNYALDTNDLKELLAVRSYIESNLEQNIEIRDLVNQTSMSESKFRKKFKQVFGSSPYDFVRDKKLWYAKGLIEEGSMISQAAYAIGYTNHSYFTRSFRKVFGMKPKEYQDFLSGKK